MIEGIYAWKRKALIVLVALAAMLFPAYCLKAQPAEQRVLWFSLPLYENNADNNAAMVDALRSPGLSWFTHVYLIVPAWQEMPNATEHVFVKHAVSILKKRGMKFLWGRFTWEAWKGSDGVFASGVDAHYKASHYAAAIATVRAEARHLGAVGCGFDSEVNGAEPPQAVLRLGLTETQQARMRWAIQEAMEITDPVDEEMEFFAYPHGYPGSSHVNSYCWPVGELGMGVTSATYYSTTVKAFRESDRFPTVPACYEFEPGLVGLHVGPEGTIAYGDTLVITPEQARAVDLAEWQAAYPSVQGLMVFVDLPHRAQIMREWKKN